MCLSRWVRINGTISSVAYVLLTLLKELFLCRVCGQIDTTHKWDTVI